jgi:DNA-binding transcriptional regulator YiaG
MKTIESPFSNQLLRVQTRIEKIPFRKEEFEVVYHFYEDAGQQFTTDETDEINLKQAQNQYRERHNLPFPDEIQEIREKYQLSAPKMAEVLGFGINVYRQYENGEVPSQSNARLIQLANDPEEFRKLVLLSDSFNQKELDKILKHIDLLIIEQNKQLFNFQLGNYLLGTNMKPNLMNGYKKPNLQKAIQVICKLIEELNPTKTSLNKLLFYTDFLHYRTNGISFMGLEYRAISYGTVPSRYDSLLEYVDENEYIKRHIKPLDNGNFMENYSLAGNNLLSKSAFTVEEQKTLDTVIENFKGKTTTQIVEQNHQEKAWIENHSHHKMVSYDYAFELKYV